jgi:hypothetical protein
MDTKLPCLRVPGRRGAYRGAALAASALAALAAVPAAGAKSFPTHPFVPGSVVIAETTYPAQGDPNIQVGQNLPSGNPAVTDGGYPETFNNDINADPNFSVATPIDLLDVDPFGDLLSQTKVPTDQTTTSFSSKSELAINFSTSGQDLSFSSYNGAPNTLDESNSNTPLVPDTTNPDQTGPFNRVAADLNANGQWTFTLGNAFSGDNGRAAVLNNATNTFYEAGNSNSGTTSDQNPITLSGGAQGLAESSDSEADQGLGSPVTRLGNFTFKSTDKFGKDTNFRGLEIYNNVVYLTKGSGSNGTNSVYFIDTTGTACSSTNGVGLPVAGAALPTLSGAPVPLGYKMCVLKGFNDLSAKGSSAPNIFPFGIFFTNPDPNTGAPQTVYVADEGAGAPSGDNPYAGASTDANAGLQKWSFNGTQWVYDYTIQAGLNLGQPYTVPGYPTGDNNYPDGSGEPWAPATDGLRNISGQVNGDGTVTIYATTSTVSGGGDIGADPNEVVAVTDELGSTTSGSETFSVVAPAKNRVRYGGVAVVPANYGS